MGALAGNGAGVFVINDGFNFVVDAALSALLEDVGEDNEWIVVGDDTLIVTVMIGVK